jgi:hypothetical protein
MVDADAIQVWFFVSFCWVAEHLKGCKKVSFGRRKEKLSCVVRAFAMLELRFN